MMSRYKMQCVVSGGVQCIAVALVVDRSYPDPTRARVLLLCHCHCRRPSSVVVNVSIADFFPPN